MNNIITLPKTEYQHLQKIAQRYEMLRRIFTLEFFEEPPIRDVRKIIKEFRQADLYNEKFLRSLERGLRESSYFSYNKEISVIHGNTSAQKTSRKIPRQASYSQTI